MKIRALALALAFSLFCGFPASGPRAEGAAPPAVPSAGEPQ